MIYQQKINVSEYNIKSTHFNGGYSAYYKLYKQFNQQKKLVKLSMFRTIKMEISMLLQFLFKPMLCIFSTKKHLHFTVKHIDNKRDSVKVETVKVIYYLFKYIPIWLTSRDYITEKELQDCK